MTRVYEELIDFIAAGSTPDAAASFHSSEETRRRAADLIDRETSSGLSADEAAELNHYMQIEHLMRLAKARARQHLSHE